MDSVKFIGYPEAVLYQNNPETTPGKPKVVKRTLWGDYAKVYNEQTEHYQKVRCRSQDGWIEKSKLQDNRLLEVNFVDVGQGDGVFLVMPGKSMEKEKFILVDAGIGDHMHNFLEWRFNFKGNDFRLPIEYLIITHPDADHYLGFKEIIENDRYKIGKIYHNGLVPRGGKNKLGQSTIINRKSFLTDVIDTQAKLAGLLNDPVANDGNDYLSMMDSALKKYPGNDLVEMLEYGKSIPGYSDGDLTIKVLGPVPVYDDKNRKLLPSFGGYGPAKNGNSIVLLITYKDVRVLLSGDLNRKSQEYLAEFYLTKAGVDSEELKKGYGRHINELRKIFEGDITKSNHHGSDDFLYEFLQGVNPIATIISSGDNETFTHPRPDTLGVIGKTSRSDNPLIFSTELARSATEYKYTEKAMAEILELKNKLAETDDQDVKDKTAAKLEKKLAQFQRNIAVYGMITVRTDGDKIIVAQKKEKKSSGFQIFKIQRDKKGKLGFKP